MSSVVPERTRVFADRLAELDDDGLVMEATMQIWLANCSKGNPASIVHRNARDCRQEMERRGRLDLYRKALKAALE